MSTNHFNKLTEAEQERLVILAEECSEVIQIVCKILRHGYDSDDDGKLLEPNRKSLERRTRGSWSRYPSHGNSH